MSHSTFFSCKKRGNINAYKDILNCLTDAVSLATVVIEHGLSGAAKQIDYGYLRELRDFIGKAQEASELELGEILSTNPTLSR